METAGILGMLGIVVTVALGAWGIYLMVTRKYPGQVTFLRESSLGLFDSIVKNMPELQVQYKGEAVGEGLVLLKGAFINTGSKDISEVMVKERISISLPDKFRWVAAKIVSASTKVEADVSVAEGCITFNSGLFRCEEYIRFEALAEVPIAEGQDLDHDDINMRLIEGLKFNHRIADTQKIKRKRLLSIEYARRRLTLGLVAGGVYVIMALVGIGIALFVDKPGKLHYIILGDDGKDVEVNAIPYEGGMLRLEGVSDETYKRTLSAKDFFGTIEFKPKVVHDSYLVYMKWSLILLMSVMFVIGVGIACGSYRSYRQTKRWRLLLDIS